MKIKNLFIYPIKSCQGISLQQALVTAEGLRDIDNFEVYDRQFMLVDENGKFITQRNYPQLANIQIKLENNHLYLSSENKNISPFQLIPNQNKNYLTVEVWKDRIKAIDQGNEVAKWFQKALNININCRLVQQSKEHLRIINSHYSIQENQIVSFADGFPILLTNTASLIELQTRINQKKPDNKIHILMDNFRPNIVVKTPTAFIEDTWKQIQICDSKIAVVKPCSRCIVTTIDQKTGIKNPLKEPLLTLSEFRNTSDGIMFGQNLIPVNFGIIKINDQVIVNNKN